VYRRPEVGSGNRVNLLMMARYLFSPFNSQVWTTYLIPLSLACHSFELLSTESCKLEPFIFSFLLAVLMSSVTKVQMKQFNSKFTRKNSKFTPIAWIHRLKLLAYGYGQRICSHDSSVCCCIRHHSGTRALKENQHSYRAAGPLVPFRV
jgi:hypothetical protein